MDAVAIRVGDRNRVGKRIQEAACRGCRGAGASAVRRNLIVVLPVQLCLPRRLFLRERVKIVRLGLLDLRGHLIFEFFVVLILFRHGVVLRSHLQNQLVRLGSLLLHLCLLLSKIVLCLLEIIHLGLELCALSRDLRGNVCHLFEHQLVGLGDLVDHVDLVEKVGEAAGAKQDRPIGDLACLLHRAQAGLVLLVEPRLLGLGLLELVLLLRDKKAVLLDLFVEIFDRLAGHLHLLVDIRLLFYERLRLGLIVLDGRLERIALLFELGLLFAQRNKLLFNFL